MELLRARVRRDLSGRDNAAPNADAVAPTGCAISNTHMRLAFAQEKNDKQKPAQRPRARSRIHQDAPSFDQSNCTSDRSQTWRLLVPIGVLNEGEAWIENLPHPCEPKSI